MKSMRILTPYFMLIAVTAIWSTNFIVGKSLTGFPPLFIAVARFTVAGLVMVPYLIVKDEFPNRRTWGIGTLMGFTGVFLFNPLVYLGLHFTTSINATLVNSLSPLSVALISSLWLKEKLPLRKLTGLIISFFGIILVATRGQPEILLNLKLNFGDLVILLNTVVWAAYTVLVKKSAEKLTPVQSTVLAMVTGLMFLVPATSIESIWWPIPHISLKVGILLVYLGLFPSVLGFYLWNNAVSKVGPTKAGIMYNLIPIFNILIAIPILNERFYTYQAVGGFLILLGVAIALIEGSMRIRTGRRLETPN